MRMSIIIIIITKGTDWLTGKRRFFYIFYSCLHSQFLVRSLPNFTILNKIIAGGNFHILFTIYMYDHFGAKLVYS
jgi:hypothetical protein